MALYVQVFLIQVTLISLGICRNYNKIPDSFLRINNKGLTPTYIDTNSFVVEWNPLGFGIIGNFSININEELCMVEYPCSDNPCIFNSMTDGADCGLDAALSACDDITVTVTRGTANKTIAFNLAPALNTSDIVPQLTLTGNKATVTWTTPAFSPDGNISCATRARTELHIGNDSVNSTNIDVSLGAPISYDWTLDDCQYGELEVRVIYLSQKGDYDTDIELHNENNITFLGVGVTTVSAQLSNNSACIIEAIWEVGCLNADHYTVTCTGKSPEDVEGNSHKMTFSKLEKGNHNISVQAVWSNGDKLGNEIWSNSVHVHWSPYPPNKLNVIGNDKTPTQLTVNWTKTTSYPCEGEVTNYPITYQEEGSADIPGLEEASNSPFTLTGLNPCTNYMVSIAAQNEWGPSGYVSSDGKTGIEVPAAPVLSVETDSSTSSTMSVSWKQEMINNCSIAKYEVAWSSETDNGTELNIKNTERSFIISGLTCNTEYDILVTAYTSELKKSSSNNVSGSTNDTPGQPTINTVSEVEDNSTLLNVTWSEPEYDCIGSSLESYNVSWMADKDNCITGTKVISGTSLIIDGLIPCTTYNVSVAATSTTGSIGIPGTGSASTSVAVPGKSTNVEREDFTPYSLNVSWNKPLDNPCNITNYTVKWVKSNGGTDQKENVDGDVTFYNILGLDACTGYNNTIIAFTEKGDGLPSDPVTLTTGTDAPTVKEFTITPESKHANVSWERPETACPLTFIVKHNGTALWTNNQTIDAGGEQTIEDPNVTAELDNLLPYSQYTVCVTVKTGNTTCQISKTEEDIPSPPRNMSCGGNADVATLTWQYPAEENGILTQYIVSWSLGSGAANSYTVESSVYSYKISGLNEGNYNFTVSANNSKGSSDPSEPIYCYINGSNSVCGGGCIAGIVVGVLLMVLAISAIIFRNKIINKIRSPIESERPYELNGAAILKTDFRNHVKNMEHDGATAAYQWLSDESPQKDKFAASRPFNKDKNRYDNIHPFDDTRVKLELLTNGPKGSDYINASYVTFPDTTAVKFIATQGPLDNTIIDFWRMVWECSVHDIVMLCNLKEKRKSKCVQYWTESGEKAMILEEFKVYCHTEEEDKSNQCITRYIDISKNGQRRLVKQHHYIAWPPFGVPDNEDHFLLFLASVKEKYNPHGKNIVVHCSAGCGRTGTFIGLWVLTSLLEEKRSARSIDVHKIALKMRDGRCDMIQNKGQYLYLHKCLLRFMEEMNNKGHARIAVGEESTYGNVGGANMGYEDTERIYNR